MPDNLWPTSLLGWFTLAGMFATAIGAIIAFARTIDRLNGLGTRLNEHIGESKILEGRVQVMERAQALLQVDRTNLHESMARITIEMQTLMKVTQAAQISRVEDLTEIRERLVRIETKVDRNESESRERDRGR